ncbi:hypothetical protein EST38_g9870 [Candolleomyces aberdarensis]|uniref:G domain-containing protein n=1 Tax=Candolleomyces aberdarensis TaxID=2316362 RepID=A0A4Q2D8U6_9AGAR|nr:hypothetical protein EST38_g9870 [Candolleomyces aberdarensis]
MENPKKTIAIVGDSGVGKSAFINAFFGKEVAQVSSETYMCTRAVEGFNYKRKDGLVLSLVDTPGFNGYVQDSKDVKTDFQILQMMSAFLDAQQDKEKSFSGIVFLRSVSLGPLPQSSKKFMRTFKKLCGDELKNVVVVTTRWDESCDDEQALHGAETAEQSLLESPGFLKDLSDAGVQFLRSGHFGDDVSQPSGAQYQPPITIVEQLLGLQPEGVNNQEHAVEEKPIQEHGVSLEPDDMNSQEQGVEGMAIQGHGVRFEADKVDVQERVVEGGEIREHDAVGFELHVADTHEQVDEGKEMQDSCDTGPVVPVNEPDTPKKTREDLKSATHEDLKRRVDKWEGLLGEFFTQWKASEDRQKSSIADQLVSFKAKQERELKSTHSEMLETQGMLNRQVSAELKQTLEASRKVCDNLSAGWQTLQKDLHAEKAMLLHELDAVKSALAEQTTQVETLKMESGSVYLPGLRSQLEEMKNDRDLAKASKLETELELEKTREELKTQALELGRLRNQVQSQTIKSELSTGRITSLETEVEEGRKILVQLAQESTCLRDQVQAKTTESELYTQQIASLKKELEECQSIKASQLGTLERVGTELEESKKGLEHEARESARLRMELAAEQKSSEEKVQALTRLRRQLQGGTRRLASLKTQLEDGKKKSQELAQKATRLKDQVRAKTSESEFRTKRIASRRLDWR